MANNSSVRHRAPSSHRRPGLSALIMVGLGSLLLVAAMLAAFTDGNKRGRSAIPLLDGGAVDLADYHGQTVLVNFWASWCPPCRAEMPELNAYYQEHQDEDFILLAVNVGEPAATARNFIQQAGFVFPVGLDTTGHISETYGVTGLPVSIVIGPDGEIRYRHVGLITREVLDAQITPLLASQ